MKFPFKKVVFDGGAVIELLLSGDDSDLYQNIVDEKIIPLTTGLAIIESEYILCRKIGRTPAFEKVDSLLDSNYFNVIPLDNFLRDISIIKCFNPIALPDCATIALAVINQVPALFAKKESELVKQLDKKPFEIDIYFLEDLLS
ncbi:MAG: hypothetical protein ACTSRG_01190 [Candidatus Helarchaeota archaeon]